MLFFKKKKVYRDKQVQWKITRKCLNLILESAKSNYPNELGAFLRVDDEEKDIISEIVLIPGTVSGDSHAIFKLHMLPVDFNIVGTVHSHPSPSFRPSDADKQLFRKHGKVHIIAAYPFDSSSWQGYDSFGENIELNVI